MRKVIFREAVSQDEAALLGMMRQLVEQEPGAQIFNEKKARGVFRELLASPNFGKIWILADESKVVGYVVLTFGYSFEYHGLDSFIDELFIEPEYRRQGLGRQTLEFVAERAREMGVHAIHLEVDNGNDAALELYRRSGFQDHERFLMTKWISR